jgi:zona occludens toxin (predicted ATPase)
VSEAYELGRKVIEDVRGVAGSRKQDDRSSISAEIEHLQLNAVINHDHLNMMRCWVHWLRCLQKQGGKAENLSHCDE